MIIGIDQSLSATGFCVLDAEGVAHHVGECKTSPKQGTDIERCHMAVEYLEELINPSIKNFVVFEGYGFGSNNLAPSVTVGAILRYVVHQMNIPYIQVAPSRLKIFSAGKGNCKKDMMRLEIYKRWGFEHNSDNVVDAYALAQFGRAFLDIEKSLNKKQQETIEKQKAGK